MNFTIKPTLRQAEKTTEKKGEQMLKHTQTMRTKVNMRKSSEKCSCTHYRILSQTQREPAEGKHRATEEVQTAEPGP